MFVCVFMCVCVFHFENWCIYVVRRRHDIASCAVVIKLKDNKRLCVQILPIIGLITNKCWTTNDNKLFCIRCNCKLYLRSLMLSVRKWCGMYLKFKTSQGLRHYVRLSSAASIAWRIMRICLLSRFVARLYEYCLLAF